jgi:hypothetical protein
MKENKTALIVLGCIGALCACLTVIAVLGAGFYFYDDLSLGNSAPAQATIAPENIPTRLPAMTPTRSAQPNVVPEEKVNPTIDDLARVSVLPFSYSDDADDADEGVAIDVVFFDAYDEVITFTGTPVKITMEFYAFTDFLNSSDISAGTLIYTETVTRDHSSTLEEMFDNYIRISYDVMKVNPNQYIRYGGVRIIVETPNGSFEDTSTLVSLYPEKE